MTDPRRALPSVDAVLREPDLAGLLARRPARRRWSTRCARPSRRAAPAGDGADGLADEVAAALRPSLRRVLNATGVILHTNLGRAPLAPEAVEAAVAPPATRRSSGTRPAAGAGIAPGPPGRATSGRSPAPRRRCVTTSNAPPCCWRSSRSAAAARSLVSRGQLVEIGGGFRVPEVLAPPGAAWSRSGRRTAPASPTTRRPIGAGDARDPARAPVELPPRRVRRGGARSRSSRASRATRGLRGRSTTWQRRAAPRAPARPASRTRGQRRGRRDLVAFSGDKLLGGPQAGIMVGAGRGRGALRARHPLMRALRPDKLILAALEATLALTATPAAP